MAILAGVLWSWAVALLATRHHLVGSYGVVPGAEPLWGFLALPDGVLLLILGAGATVTTLAVLVGRNSRQVLPRPTGWLLVSSLIPALDLLRLLGIPIPMTFLEPLLMAGITGAAAGQTAEVLHLPRIPSPPAPLPPGEMGVATQPLDLRQRIAAVPWWALAWVLAIAAGAWWYHQGQAAYADYLLGFNDFGHFGWRVVNTWEGRGFLMETPSLPAFWDHFNPGLALLAPFWGLWPDPRLFVLVQATCLALPAPLVYGSARRMGAGPGAAVAWAAAYLMFPAVGQLNLNYTYGWHPVSLALPLLFAALLALLHGRRIAALVFVLLACSFQEDVLVILGCLAVAMALWAWLDRRRREHGSSQESSPLVLADCLPIWAWIAAAAVLAGAFVMAFKLAGFSGFQVSRFAKLGDSAWEVVLSPLVRPRVFWGTVLRARSAYFLLSLLVPLGVAPLCRGRWFLLACVPPLGVLIAWGHPPATSIAFQYTTALIPVLFLAAMAGATKCSTAARTSGESRPSPPAALPRAGEGSAETAVGRASLWRAGVSALAASAVASLWIGALPWSSPTLTDVLGQTYAMAGDPHVLEDRRAGSPGNALLNQIVAQVGTKHASVLATGRIAAHLLGVRRLDTVGQARGRWEAFEAEVGPGRSAIELFDWIVLDTKERFQQSSGDLDFVVDKARRAGYRVVQSARGIVVMGKPR